jgi:hypothetical protein
MRETKLINISQFIHVKDISKVNDNGNQYKQKLILWYWTTNYFLMGFTFQNINVFSKISKESTSFYHIHEKYSVSSTFLYNGNSKCYVVRIQWLVSTPFKIYNGILSNLYITITISYYNSISLTRTFSSPV